MLKKSKEKINKGNSKIKALFITKDVSSVSDELERTFVRRLVMRPVVRPKNVSNNVSRRAIFGSTILRRRRRGGVEGREDSGAHSLPHFRRESNAQLHNTEAELN